MGIISSGVGIGIFVGVPSIQHLINRAGWRMTYVVMALFIPLSIVFMAILFLKKRPGTISSNSLEEEIVPSVIGGSLAVDDQWASRSWTLRQAVFTKPFCALSMCFFFSGSITQSILAHHVAFFVDQGLEALFASYIVGITGIVSILGKILWGTLSDRIGREVTYTLVIFCSTCGMIFLIAFTILSSPCLPFLYAVFFGMGYAGMASLPPLITADFFGGRAYGRIFGTLFILNGIGGAFGAWFAGFLYDQVRSYLPFFVIMIVCGLLACLVLWIAAPRKIRRVPGKDKT